MARGPPTTRGHPCGVWGSGRSRCPCAALANPEGGRSLLRSLSSGVSREARGRAAGARGESSSRNAPRSSPLPPALPPRPRRWLAGRRPSREGGQPGVPAQAPGSARPPRPAPPPPPVFRHLRPTQRPPETPPAGSKLCAPSAGAILAKFVRLSPLPTCAGDAPARAARAPGPRGPARSPGRTGESPPSPPPAPLGGRAEPPPPPQRGGVSEPRGGGGRGDLAYLRWRRAAAGRPRGLCAAARRARSGGERATTNGDISRRSTWRASGARRRPQAPRSSAEPAPA